MILKYYLLLKVFFGSGVMIISLFVLKWLHILDIQYASDISRSHRLINSWLVSFTMQEARVYAEENGLFFIEASAKTAANVNEIFYEIGESYPMTYLFEELYDTLYVLCRPRYFCCLHY